MLPSNATATDVIDLLSEQVTQLVTKVNAGREITPEQFAAAHERAFTTALPIFLDKLAQQRPELAERMRAQFLAEQEQRMRVEAAPACEDCGAAAGQPCETTCRTYWTDAPPAELD